MVFTTVLCFSEKAHPTLYTSILTIHTQRLKFSSQKAAIFNNFKMSHRGSIRKPPSAVTWVVVLAELEAEHGEKDPTAVIKSWNTEAAIGDRIVGAKSMAVKNIMKMDPETKALLVQHVMKHTWDACAFTEDVLACGKFFPGYQPRGLELG